MEIHFLGTGAAHPSPTRGASSLVVRLPSGSCWMFDCGEGTQTQLMKSNIRPGKLDKIFITHLHGDHLFGLPGLLCTISLNSPDGRSAVHLYGPKGLGHYLTSALTTSGSFLSFSCVIHELCPADDTVDKHQTGVSPETSENNIQISQIFPTSKMTWNVFDNDNMAVSAAELKHRITCYGYVIQEGDLPGRLNAELLKSKGIPPGPLYAKIKSGQCIYTEDGSEIRPEDVLSPPPAGQKIVILGDTCNSEQIMNLAMNADVLIHEATNENSHQEKCIENGHSTPGMAVHFAKSIQAKKLILTHFSQRYKGQDEVLKAGEESVLKLLQEAKDEFDNVIAAQDMLVVNIKRTKKTEQLVSS
ncbi:zinc phosphodiesterase ELAC protein 1-like [Dendronephthya gigantea]|uniref:zinc phosphodiesterase ELAC protein 1-like n=1 Tax=Dendronephthya gigantea TaxID=151771 RepID=UPI00106B38E7|nr:zinc phosphodiesterase ELAC protein 1-like [Dendronephthya gigantea]